jgi:D-alanyl-D-alanine carboxypeptidase (penicillin-binding protein 5/6)
MSDFPEYVGFYAIKKYRYPGTPAANDSNRNLLLFRDPTVDGLKTGHTEAAGYCMVATAKRDFPNLVAAGAAVGSAAAAGNRRLLSIVLGAQSENARANESQKLLNWGYTAYEAVKLFDGGQAVVSPSVWKGSVGTVRLGRPQSIVVAVPQGTASKIKTQVLRTEPLLAPITKGQQLATLRVTVGDLPALDVSLLALDPVGQAGILGRAWDSIRLWIQ